MPRHLAVALIGLLAALLPGRGTATAQDFYRGKTITIICGYGVGGGYDLYARLLARHLAEHIPGKPAIIVQTMTGAGGMRAANMVYTAAPRDGTVIAATNPTLLMYQLMGGQAARYETAKLQWIGSLDEPNNSIITWHTSGTKTLADLKTRETLVASTGPLSQAEINSTMLNGVVGTKFKLIRGYRGSSDAALAVERGEADGTLMPWEFLKSAHADWVRDNKISIVARYVRRAIPERADVRSVYDLAETNQQRNVLKLFLGSDEMGHPIAMPPGATRNRVDAVRLALQNMVRDPEFLADATKRKLDLLPARWDELEQTVADAFEATSAEIEIAQKYYKQ
jgi:tripartite-type tricarboxylate transporter receptor subunit TctC